MKTIFFIFLTIVLFSPSVIAQIKGKQESTYLKIKSGDENTTYEFYSIRDFEENSEKILDEITTSYQPDKKGTKTAITIEISITVSSNTDSTTLTGSVTASQETIIQEVKKLRTQMITIVTG